MDTDRNPEPPDPRDDAVEAPSTAADRAAVEADPGTGATPLPDDVEPRDPLAGKPDPEDE